MRKLRVDAITGDEVLARDIFSDMDTILMSKGITLKKEYIDRLNALNIKYVLVEDDLAKGIKEEEIIERHIKEQCQKAVREVLHKFSYCGDAQLVKLKEVAEEIITDLLEQPEIMFTLEGVRENDENNYSHSLNVCALSVFIALRMNLPQPIVKNIAVGSILHDIGFSYLPTDYKKTDYIGLTEKEKKEVKKHVIYGYSAIEKESWLSEEAKNIILTHHERLDGSGYPFHLKGDKIKIETRIVAVCDEFDCMVYGYYTEQTKIHEAIEYIVSQGTSKFDLVVTKIFQNSVAAYPNGTIVITNKGDTGIVLRQNKGFPTRPVIRIIQNQKGVKNKEWVEKDLTKELSLFIKDTTDNM